MDWRTSRFPLDSGDTGRSRTQCPRDSGLRALFARGPGVFGRKRQANPAMKNPARWFATAVLSLAVIGLNSATAQEIPKLAAVPANLPPDQREILIVRRAALVQERAALKGEIEAHNGKEALEGSSEAEQLHQEADQLRARIQTHVDASLRFNESVAAVLKAFDSAQGEGGLPSAPIRQEAEQRCLQAAQAPSLQQELQNARDEFSKGYSRESELKADALLESARAAADADARSEIQRWKDLQNALARGKEELFKDPVMRKAWEESEAFLKSVEEEVDQRMRAGLVPPEDADLDLLFDSTRSVRVWPGPKDPNPPLANPLQDDARREKVRQMVILERRENEEVAAFLESPEFKEAEYQEMCRQLGLR